MRSKTLRAWHELALAALCCTTDALGAHAQALAWQRRADLDTALPPSIRVLEGARSQPPLRAWLVEAQLPAREWELRVELAPELESVPSIAARTSALVAVNAGYFAGRSSVSLAIDQGRVLSPNVATLRRGDLAYHPTRAAFALLENGTPDIAWIAHIDGAIRAYSSPSPIRDGTPQAPPSVAFPTDSAVWPARLAIGGGPLLVTEHRERITWEEEVFFGSGIGAVDERAPRTALGYTADRRLLIVIADGRSELSLGLSLRELARLFVELGALEAMNLDGGGSTTLVVRGALLNTPSDSAGPRAVASALAFVESR